MDRPTKQLKSEIPAFSDGDATPRDEPPYTMESDGEDGPILPLSAATADSAEWQATIEKVVRNVVSIHFWYVVLPIYSAISSLMVGV